ncbi:MAG: hypothetical protein MUF32_00390 [Burkholderiaceae bacterium]|nr:hypothetical protein [Burkholderiaceae bacterium]
MRRLLCCLLLAALSPPGAAATFVVEEVGTFPQTSSTAMRWRQVAPSRGGDNTVEGSVAVTVRLNLAPFRNKTGKLYLALPQQPVTPVAVSWTTQGRLLPGQLVSGQRGLVYAGPIALPLLEETLLLKIEADGTRLSSAQNLTFHFEIDVD